VASQRTLLVREPFEIEREAGLVTIFAEAAAGVLPNQVRIGGASYWADAAVIAAAGIPTVLFGPAARARTPSRGGSACRIRSRVAGGNCTPRLPQIPA
jgi:hypothetical protein